MTCIGISSGAHFGAALREILVGSLTGVAICGPCHCVRGGVPPGREREAHEGGKRLLALRLRPISSKATHPPTYLPLHMNRGRYCPRRLGHRAGTGHVTVTPGEANVTRRGATGQLGRTGGVEGDGEATPPRRFPPRGAPWTGLPRAGPPPLPSSPTPRRRTGRPTAGPRRWCDPGW